MIDEADKRLCAWVNAVLGEPLAVVRAPQPAPEGRGVGVYPIGLFPKPPRGAHQNRLEASLRYLVTAWSKDTSDAHRMLGNLLFAAMDQSEFEIELAPLPLRVWEGFGVPPQLSILLRCPLRKELPARAFKAVRKVVFDTVTASGVLEGVVLGPGDTPLTGAQVDLPALQRSTQTGADGKFVFRSVPSELGSKKLLIQAKGRSMTCEIPLRTDPPAPFVIHFVWED